MISNQHHHHRIAVATHKPTGESVRVNAGHGRGSMSLADAKALAAKLLRAKLASPQPTAPVRSYHLNPHLGLDPFIRDERTGETYRGSEVVNAVLDGGDIDRVRPTPEPVPVVVTEDDGGTE